MSSTTDAILAAVAKAALDGLEAWAKSPSGKATIERAKEMVESNLPGWEGFVIRTASAALPHHVESLGFKKDGPG